MSSWGNYKNSANAPLWAASSANLPPTRENIELLYNNNTPNEIIQNLTVGLFSSNNAWIIKKTGSGGRSGRVQEEILVCVSQMFEDSSSPPTPAISSLYQAYYPNPTIITIAGTDYVEDQSGKGNHLSLNSVSTSIVTSNTQGWITTGATNINVADDAAINISQLLTPTGSVRLKANSVLALTVNSVSNATGKRPFVGLGGASDKVYPPSYCAGFSIFTGPQGGGTSIWTDVTTGNNDDGWGCLSTTGMEIAGAALPASGTNPRTFKVVVQVRNNTVHFYALNQTANTIVTANEDDTTFDIYGEYELSFGGSGRSSKQTRFKNIHILENVTTELTESQIIKMLQTDEYLTVADMGI